MSKGERSKAKFPSININNIYLESRGESTEIQKQQKTANRKPGFQILGKVSTARRPANLPSVKSEKNNSENINSNTTNNNVTTIQGWNKQEASSNVTTTTPCQTSTQSNTTMTISINTSNVQLHTNSDKSWSSITSSGIENNQQPPKFYGSQFQQEFPSLSSSDSSVNQQKTNVELSFLQSTSLRPQTEGFWASGGQTKSTVSTSENKLTNNTSQLMSIQSCNTIQSTQLAQPMRNIMPSFVSKSNYPVNISTNVTKSSISPNYTTSNVMNRKYVSNNSYQSMENKTTTNAESVGFRGKPIINQDELGKMDIKTRNAGWATRDDIDYNQKLTFSDDEDNQTRNKKNEEVVNEKKQVKLNKTPSEIISKPQQQPQQSQQPQQQTDNLEDEDIWNQRRLQQSKEIALAAERARKRKEEEEKRFLENKGKDDVQNSNQIKTDDEMDKENVKCGYSNLVEALVSSQSIQNVEGKSMDKENRSTFDLKNSPSINNDTLKHDLNNQKTNEDKCDSYLKMTNIESLRNEIYESKTSMEDYAIFDCSDYESETSSTNIGTSQWGKIDKSNKPWDSSPIIQKERIRQFTTRSSISNRDEKRQVPGPITREKIEADDLKNEKRELVSLKPTLHGFDRKSDQSSSISTKTTTATTSSITNSTMSSNTYSKISGSSKGTTVKNNDRNTKQAEKQSSTKADNSVKNVSEVTSSTAINTKSISNVKETATNRKTTAIVTTTTNETTTTIAMQSGTTLSTNVTSSTALSTNATKSKRILEDGWTFASENKPDRNLSLNRDTEHNKTNSVNRNVSDKKPKDDEISKKSDRSYNEKRTNNINNKNDNRYWDYGTIYESSYNSRGRRVASDTRKKYTKGNDYGNYEYDYDYDYNYDYDYDYDDRRRYRGSTVTKSSVTKRSSKDKGNDIKSSKSATNHEDTSKFSSPSGKGKPKEDDSVEKLVENTKKNEQISKPESEIKEMKKSFDEPSSKKGTHFKNESQNKNQSGTNESKKSLVRKSKSDLGENDEMTENMDQKSMYSDDDYSAKRSSKGYGEFYNVNSGSYRNKTRNQDRRITPSSSNNTQWNKTTKVTNYKSSYPKHNDSVKKSTDYKDKTANYKNDTIDSAKYENSEQKVHHGTIRSYGKTFSSHKTYDENATRESRFERQKSFGNSNNVHKYSKKYPENNQENRNSLSKDVSSSKSTTNTNHNHVTNVSATTTHNAWNKPITNHLKSDSGFNSVSKSDQTSENVKCVKNCSEKDFILDGSTAPVNTIIFENKNFKSVPKQPANNLDQGKLKYRNQSKSNEKNCANTNFKKDDEHLPNSMLFNKPLSDIITESLHKHESIEKNASPSSTSSPCAASLQISMSFNKNEDNSDMKLDFGFESELNPSTEDKNKNITSANASTISTGQSELNKKIQSVKKVWETNVLEQSLHHDEDNFKSVYETNGGAFTASSNASLDTSESPSVVSATVVAGVGGSVNIPNSTAPNICKVKPTTQTTHVSFNIPPSNNNVVIGHNLLEQKHSPPPQLLQILNSGSVNLNQFPQQFSANQHLSYQANVNNSVQFNGMSTISSPPTALVLNSTQNNLYGQLQIDQSQNRSQYAQFATALPPHPSSYNIGQNATSSLCGSMPSLYLTTPPPSAQTQDIYQNLASQYRLTQNAAFGQPQQINNPATVLISSTSNSLMSASVKQSSQQLSAIGTKCNQSFHQSSQHAQSQAQPPQPLQAPPPQPQPPQPQLYMTAPYDSAGIPSNFLSNANVLQRSTLGPAVQSNILASSLQGHSSNFYSSTNVTQNAHFQQSANSALPAGSSYGMHNNIFGPSQNFGSQFLPSIPINSNNSMAQPFRTNTIQAQNASYLKSYSGELRSNLNQDPMSSYNSATVQQTQSRNKPKPINSPVSPSNKNFQNINTSLNNVQNKVRHTFLNINRSNITKSNNYNNENTIVSKEHNSINFLKGENNQSTETENTEDNGKSMKNKLGNK